MRVITVFNHKGGCGKTTTAINLAATLAEAKKRVLLVDFDPQAHATVGCGVREEEVELSTWHLMRAGDGDSKPLGLADIAWEISNQFCLAPASVGLATVEQTLAGAEGRETRLKRLLAPVADRYDVAIIDCGPGLGILAINALVAATEVLVPVDLGFFSIYGIGRTLATINMIAAQTQRTPAVHILPTLYDTRARTMRRSLGALRDQHGSLVMETVIRFNTALREAAAMGSTIVEFRPESRGHEDYRALAQELLASDLHLEYEALQRQEVVEAEQAEQAIDRKIELVYGATLVGGGVRFVVHAPEAGRVQIAGDFNKWNATNGDGDLEPTDQPDVWQRQVTLPAGRYAYRLIIDGRWCSDPANPYVESNPYGELNSVVEVS